MPSEKEYNIEYNHLEFNHFDLPFLTERMKIEKVKKLVTNLHDKTEFKAIIKSSNNFEKSS